MREAAQHNDGGCFCGSVRYTLIGPPEWSSHCHCRSCQKALGAAFATWVGAKSENFKVTKGQITKAPGQVSSGGFVVNVAPL